MNEQNKITSDSIEKYLKNLKIIDDDYEDNIDDNWHYINIVHNTSHSFSFSITMEPETNCYIDNNCILYLSHQYNYKIVFVISKDFLRFKNNFKLEIYDLENNLLFEHKFIEKKLGSKIEMIKNNLYVGSENIEFVTGGLKEAIINENLIKENNHCLVNFKITPID